tara:strand:- start:544 stop:2742 length:2199 start_codon:yes stop_codon:yes gene_type:complete
MSFFEPDVLVEAEPGLATSIGYGALGDDRYEAQLIGLDELFTSEGEHEPELRFGLSVIDAYRDIYESQRQFILRDKHPSFVFNETKLSPIAEAVFGAFPMDDNAQDFMRAYVEVFEPVAADVGPEHWFEFFQRHATVPFTPTYHNIEVTPRGRADLAFFVFDHTEPADLIDYWNKRLSETPVYPVPLCWLDELSETMVEMITRNHRPIPNNSFGTNFHSTLYFSRSIGPDEVSALIEKHFSACPEESFYRSGVWHPKVQTSQRGPGSERHRHTAGSAQVDAPLTDGKNISFDSLDPPFASRFGIGHHRWANVVNLDCNQSDELALFLPTNLEDRSTPRLYRSLLERPVVTREGWVLGKRYKNSMEWMELSDGPKAIGEWLARKGITAEPSNAGRIARQAIDSLGSLWATHLIADEETLRLLNKMAMQEVSKGVEGEAIQHRYESRTAPFHTWKTLIGRRGKGGLPRLSLEEFAKRGVLKLGLSVDCPHCTHSNWYGLDDVAYELLCDRCLRRFDFPQGGAEKPWRYRVVGPFSVPNFAEGAYGVALTLNMFKLKLLAGFDVGMTYSTGLNLVHDKFKREIDFAFWYGTRSPLAQREEPRFIIGEAKSFAEEAIAKRDIESLMLVAEAIPGSVIVVSVMKASFSEKERELLSALVRWGWERVGGKIRAQVIVLTGRELFADFNVGSAWKKAGDPFDQFDAFHVLSDLDEFARATQKIHLGLDTLKELRTRHGE